MICLWILVLEVFLVVLVFVVFFVVNLWVKVVLIIGIRIVLLFRIVCEIFLVLSWIWLWILLNGEVKCFLVWELNCMFFILWINIMIVKYFLICVLVILILNLCLICGIRFL